MPKPSTIFNTVRTEGAILPAELLQRIVGGDATLEGLKPTDYHLSPGERLGEAATRSWNRLIGVWQTYRDIVENLSEEATGTTETRERWLLPLFQELGYGRLQTQRSVEIEGKTYPISHKASEPVAIHLVSFKWDLDKRPTSALTTYHSPLTTPHSPLTTRHLPKYSPHSLMQEYLNRSPHHLWGLLSNGSRLRILRNNVSLTRAAYVEFDLQAMMDGLAYSDFFLLYLLCHQSRVEVKTDETGRLLPPQTCWLEQWYNTSIKDGVRALDELRNNVQSAIESLGAGFLSHPGNTALRDKLRSGTLNLQDYYHQVLLQVYRLLFIFVAEDRDMLIPDDVPDKVKQTYLKYYSTYRIRELASKKRGTRHSDLWHQFVMLFNGLYGGNMELGLPALGSFLFSDKSTQDLNDLAISNSDLLSAIRFLCYTQQNNIFQSINYRNLGSEELGSVYESLLEMHPEINLDAGYFKLNLVSGSERKTTGSYYTPSSLVNCLLDSALEPVIANAVSGKAKAAILTPTHHLLLTTHHSPLTTHHSPEQALLALKICDPACGSGHFLISAAHRIAKRLAAIRAGEDEPAPSLIQNALRDVIGNCIYGVDINPMAVELCKISLWMEALDPGKPLTFLDHHIQCGNSLLGCTPELLQNGIPDAAFTPLTGDDKTVCARYKKLNRDESKGDVIDIFSSEGEDWLSKRELSPGFDIVNRMADDDLQSLQAKERGYADFIQSPQYQNAKFIHDAWCAAFMWIKDGASQRPEPITHGIMERIKSNPETVNPAIKQEVARLAKQYRFFHWHLAFPDVFPDTTSSSHHLATSQSRRLAISPNGFDCVLGNPPWERVKLQETEFFASKDEQIATAPNAAARKRLIQTLPETNPALYQNFLVQKRISEANSHYIRESEKYPLCGRGDVNTYTIFAELNRDLLSSDGRCGCIIPSGIATDDTTKYFFQDIFDSGSLISFYDFDNRGKLFPDVISLMKFCLLTLRAPTSRSDHLATSPSRHLAHLPSRHLATSPADFVFFAQQVSDLRDEQRHFQLSAADIALINPNTRTCPIFRGKADAELTKYIYRRVPILINENDTEHGNPWGISFHTMFHMSNDSHLFKTREQLENLGFELHGNRFVSEGQDWLPLYEAKMIHHFNHRFGDYADLPAGSASSQLPEIPLSRLQSADYEPLPRYWVPETEVEKAAPGNNKYFLGFRDICRSTDERTVIGTVLPMSAVGNNLPIWISTFKGSGVACFVSCLSSFMSDFIARFKVGGTHLNFFIAQQLPILPPGIYSSSPHLETYIVPRVLELTYTSHSLAAFARDLGYDGHPFIWDEQRRFEIRYELDALFFHLYLGSDSDWQGTTPPSGHLAYSPSHHLANSPSDHLATSPSGHLATSPSRHNAHFPSPRHAVEYIMESFPIVKRKDEKEYGEYRTKRRILEIFDQMTHCLATNTEYRSTLDPPPGPPRDEHGHYIPVADWVLDNWPSNIHLKHITGV